MSFLSSLAAWQWAVMACVPVGIVLLYFLKLKRQPIEVPSTFLWVKTIEDLHVNSLLQRLRTTPLLILQLLAVALAALALLRPGYRDEAFANSRRILLLDVSASMNATDTASLGQGDATRFEAARRMIGESIEAMTDQDVAMLMTISDRADVLQSFTSDRRKLRDALAAARPTNRPTDILPALRAAEGLANRDKPRSSGDEVGDDDQAEPQAAAATAVATAEIVLLSDGGFKTSSEIDFSGLNFRYARVGGDEITNLAIVAMSAQRNDEREGTVELFATIANLGTTVESSAVSLMVNGELVDADRVELQPGDETGLSFELDDQPILKLQLSIDERDDLVIDNTAFTALAPVKTVSVLLVTPGNRPLELALTTGEAEKLAVVEIVAPGYLETDAYRARATVGVDELIIYDRCRPAEMPLTSTFFIGALPSRDWSWSETKAQVQLIDIDRSHPIMRYLDLFSLLIAEGHALVPPPGSVDLLVGDSGTALSIASREGCEDLVLGFDILSTSEDGGTTYNTDWQVQRSWPVFVLNAMRYLTGVTQLDTQRSHQPGQVLTLTTDRRQGELSIRKPTGEIEFVKPDSSGRLNYTADDSLGVYELEDEKRVVDLFAVNLFDRQESRLQSQPTVQIGFNQVQSDRVAGQSRRELWRWLLLGVLGVLSLEWWYYAKRLG